MLYKRFIFPASKESRMVGFLGILGVFVGVFAIIVVISVMLGFEDKLIARITNTEAHIYLYPKDDIVIDPTVLKKLNALYIDGIELSSLFIETETVFYMANTSTGGVVFGASSEFLKHLLSVKYDLKRGEVFIGKELAGRSELFVDDSFDALSVWNLLHNSNLPRLSSFVIKGLVRTGSFTKDASYVYITIDDAMTFFSSISGMAQGIAILTKDPMSLDEVVRDINKSFPYLEIKTWQDRNSSILLSLKIERLLMLFILIFVLLVASFSVMGSVVLDLESRTSDFALLLALGLEKMRLKKMIISIAIVRSVIGALLGGVFGGVFTFLLAKYRFIQLPVIYYDPVLPVRFSLSLIFYITLSAVLMGVLGTLFSIRNVNIPIINRIKH